MKKCLVTYVLCGVVLGSSPAWAEEPKLPESLPPVALAEPALENPQQPLQPVEQMTDQQQAAMTLIYILLSSQVNPAQLLK